MKKFYLIPFLFLFVCTHIFSRQCSYGDNFTRRCTDCDRNNYHESQTFMMTRPVSHNVAAEQSLWHDFLYNKKEKGGSFQVMTYYQQSIQDSETIRYFTFGCKVALKARGDNDPDAKFRDIRAEWVGLPSDFRGTMSINPEQRQFACVITYNQDLKKYVDYDFLKRFWLEVSLPIVAVENHMNVCQYDVFNKSDQYPQDLISAFNQCEWKYQKINGKMSRLNLAPIRIRFGGAFMADGNNQIASYSAFLLPTGQEDCNHYLFEPTAGYNGHLGYGTGVNFQFVLNRDNDQSYDFCFFLNLEGVFLIRNWHCRTFDLKCLPYKENCPSCRQYCSPCEYQPRPWSRYLQLNCKGGIPEQNIPGVNILTRRVKVRPYNVIDLSMGFRLKSERYEFEVGYNIWGHGSERIECIEKFKHQWGIAGAKQDGDQFARSASLSTICQRKATSAEELPEDDPDYAFIPICESDLDLDSAASQGALNHIVHAAGGVEYKGDCVDAFFGFGAYYDYAQKNSALKTWGVWAKLGGSF